MKHLVLFPSRELLMNDETHQALRERFPRDEHEWFFVEDSPQKLEGVRFNDAYVHWYCFEEINYNVYVALILQARAFSSERGETYLFT